MPHKILVVGATGMLGHKLVQTLNSTHETFAAVRQPHLDDPTAGALRPAHILTRVSAEDFSTVEQAFESVQPTVVINCVGIVKQLAGADDPLSSISINALFPHQLSKLSSDYGSRMITLSTDCVFSGKRGNYSIDDTPDPHDLYGRTKLLGEVSDNNCLTIRTSMIGRQLTGAHSLVEWLLSRTSRAVLGYKKAIFSGFTTIELSHIILQLIEEHANLQGVWQIASSPISKFDLLTLIKEVYELKIEIIPDETVVINRSLDGNKFVQSTGIQSKSWTDMIEQMYRDPIAYGSPKVSRC